MPNDEPPVSDPTSTAVMALYEHALGDVYGYLIRRCTNTAIAEDLTADTFLAAAYAARHGTTHVDDLSVAWLIGTARHKLIDHWRRDGRHRAALEELWGGGAEQTAVNDALHTVEAMHVRQVLSRLTVPHRTALTLRYLDGLAVGEVARHLDRSVHATESLLIRAKAAYRDAAAHLEGDPS